MAPPIDEPLSNRAVAKLRSRLGNHSETALVAPGQLPPGAQKKSKSQETCIASGERRKNRNDRIPQNGNRQTKFCSDAIQEPAADGLANRVGHAKSHYDIGVIGVGPVVFHLEIGSEERESLAVHVIDDRGGKQDSSNPPSQTVNRASSSGILLHGISL